MISNYNIFNTNFLTEKDNCPICLYPLKNEISIAHEGEGQKHPIHLKCAEVFANAMQNINCPHCRKAVVFNKDLLIVKKDTSKDRSINFKWIAKVASNSLALGIAGAEFNFGSTPPLRNPIFLATQLYGIIGTIKSQEFYGSMIGAYAGALTAGAIVFGTAIMTDPSCMEESVFNALEVNPTLNYYVLSSFTSIGMTIGAYLEKKR